MAISMTGKSAFPTLGKLVPQRSGSRPAPRSPAERLWILGGTAAGLVLLLIGYFMLIGPQRSSTSSVQAEVSAAQAQQQGLDARIAALRADAKNLPKYEAQLAAAQAALPATSGVSDLLRELQNIAASTSTTVATVSVGAPTSLASATGAGTALTGSAPNSTAQVPTSAAPAAGAPAAAAALPSNVYSMLVSTSVTGSPSALTKFLQQLQEVAPRAVLITSLSETATPSVSGKGSGSSSLALSMLAFMTSDGATAPAAVPTTAP